MIREEVVGRRKEGDLTPFIYTLLLATHNFGSHKTKPPSEQKGGLMVSIAVDFFPRTPAGKFPVYSNGNR